MKTMKTVELSLIIFLFMVFSGGFAEESPCTPGFESEFLDFKVHRDHLHKGMRLGRVNFVACTGGHIPFQSSDTQFDVKMDGTVMLKTSVNLHEGRKVFSVHAWDSSGKKHTVSVRVECVHHQEDNHMDVVTDIFAPQLKKPSHDLVMPFPNTSGGLKRAKRGWVIPPFSVPENSRGPFPQKLVQIKSEYSDETQMEYKITGEGADLEPKGTFTIERLSGILQVTRPLDRETKASYRLIAHANGVNVNVEEKPMEIVVDVSDQNDNRPVFAQNPFHGHVHDAALKDHEFMRVPATDADDPNTNNADLRYKILSQDPPFPKPKMFEINSVTGGIYVLESGMDREQWRRYTLVIQAADMRGEGLSTTSTAVFNVTDSNDNAPLFDETSLTVSAPENKVGAVVAKLKVTDEDEPESPAWLTKFQIISGDNDGFFSVSTGPSQLEGIITTVKPLDFEKNNQYILSVIAENDDPFVISLATSTATVTVNVEDLPELFCIAQYIVSATEKDNNHNQTVATDMS